jgi:hypothetical protein
MMKMIVLNKPNETGVVIRQKYLAMVIPENNY